MLIGPIGAVLFREPFVTGTRLRTDLWQGFRTNRRRA